MTKPNPSVQILATCPDGHQTFWFPERVIRLYDYGDTMKFEWECPVCPRDNYKHEVEL